MPLTRLIKFYIIVLMSNIWNHLLKAYLLKSPKLGFYQIIAELRNTAVKYDQGAMHSYVY